MYSHGQSYPSHLLLTLVMLLSLCQIAEQCEDLQALQPLIDEYARYTNHLPAMVSVTNDSTRHESFQIEYTNIWNQRESVTIKDVAPDGGCKAVMLQHLKYPTTVTVSLTDPTVDWQQTLLAKKENLLQLQAVYSAD